MLGFTFVRKTILQRYRYLQNNCTKHSTAKASNSKQSTKQPASKSKQVILLLLLLPLIPTLRRPTLQRALKHTLPIREDFALLCRKDAYLSRCSTPQIFLYILYYVK